MVASALKTSTAAALPSGHARRIGEELELVEQVRGRATRDGVRLHVGLRDPGGTTDQSAGRHHRGDHKYGHARPNRSLSGVGQGNTSGSRGMPHAAVDESPQMVTVDRLISEVCLTSPGAGSSASRAWVSTSKRSVP